MQAQMNRYANTIELTLPIIAYWNS